MELNKRSFADVVLDLAQRYQVPVQTLEPAKRQELQRQLTLREQLYEILAVTARFYEARPAPERRHGGPGLPAPPAGAERRHYSAVSAGVCARGVADPLRLPGRAKSAYPVELVEQAGLILPRKTGSGYYDRFPRPADDSHPR